MSDIEIDIGSTNPRIKARLMLIERMPEPDKTQVMGMLLVHIGTQWQIDAAAQRLSVGT